MTSHIIAGETKANIDAILHTIEEGQDITAEKSSVRVTLYQSSIILTHRLYVIVACAACGKVKTGYVTGDELSPAQKHYLGVQMHELPQCTCEQKEESL